MDTPYLSIVATSRNDDHGHNMLGRMQTFINALIGQCRDHNLPAELILVEWNPPAERPRLAQALRWPADSGPCQVRIIEVPPELHGRFQHSKALPLFQMIGKNVGIRRARGEFVLATNIDILFSDELMRFFAERRLQHGRMYRIDRHDVMADVPVDGTVADRLDYCRTHLLRVNTRDGNYPLTPAGTPIFAEDDIFDPKDGIHLDRGWLPLERRGSLRFRWTQPGSEITLDTSSPDRRVLSLEIESGPGVSYYPFELDVRDGQDEPIAAHKVTTLQWIHVNVPAGCDRLRFLARNGGKGMRLSPKIMDFRVFRIGWNLQNQPLSTVPWFLYPLYRLKKVAGRVRRAVGRALTPNYLSPVDLHTFACGDFTLMARKHWFDLNGNPELEMYSFHIDSLMCYMAHHGGAVEEVLSDPMRIYHIEHGAGSGWTPEGESKLMKRLAEQKIPVLSYKKLMQWATCMRRHEKAMIFNKASWGLGDEDLPETIVGAPAAHETCAA